MHHCLVGQICLNQVNVVSVVAVSHCYTASKTIKVLNLWRRVVRNTLSTISTSSLHVHAYASMSCCTPQAYLQGFCGCAWALLRNQYGH